MTKVLIVDDLSSIREFLKINLSSQPDLEVVGIADSGQGAIIQAEEHQPDVILMDINMPGALDGIQATEHITQRFPQSKVLLFTSQDDSTQLDRALKAGSRGYILKNTSIRDIAEIIRLAEKGFFQIGPIVDNWDNSLHRILENGIGRLVVGNKSLAENVTAPVQNGYSAEVGKMPKTDSSKSNPGSELFRLQQKIESQENTIAQLKNQYSEAQEIINSKQSKEKTPDKSSGFNIYSSKPSKSLIHRREHMLFISSFFLGVITVLILVLIIVIVSSI